MTKSQWRKRLIPASSTRRGNITETGLEIADPKPHELLLCSPKIPSLQEQVESLTRIGRTIRQSFLQNLPEDYYGEDIEDDINSEGTTLAELDGAKDFWDDREVQSHHQTPEDVNAGTKQASPQGETPLKEVVTE